MRKSFISHLIERGIILVIRIFFVMLPTFKVIPEGSKWVDERVLKNYRRDYLFSGFFV